MTKGDIERDISRHNLELHKIFYDPEVYNISPTHPSLSTLPDHVDAVRETLLTFESIIPREWEGHLREEFNELKLENENADLGPVWTHHPPASALIREKRYERDLGEHSAEWMAANENLKCSERAVSNARDLLADPEAEWNLFWRTQIFKRYSAESRTRPEFSPTLDSWSLYESVTWNECDTLDGLPFLAKKRTRPKPDLTYAFPIQSSKSKRPTGFARDEFGQCLGLEVLGKLSQQGVFCAPTTGLSNWTKNPDTTILGGSDLCCFPWAVVEMKRFATEQDNAFERCYCQAANAAATALKLQAQLFDQSNILSQAPPVIAFTSVGPTIKVWLAYYDKQGGMFGTSEQRMVCIWSTSVLLTWGVASLRTIIMNMHLWAARLLKPKIQACVVEAYARLKSSGPSKSSLLMSPIISASAFSSPQINTPESSPFRFTRTPQMRFFGSPRIDTPSSSLPFSVQEIRAFCFGPTLRKAPDEVANLLNQAPCAPMFGTEEINTEKPSGSTVPADPSDTLLHTGTAPSKTQTNDSLGTSSSCSPANTTPSKSIGIDDATVAVPTPMTPRTSACMARKHSTVASNTILGITENKKDVDCEPVGQATGKKPSSQSKTISPQMDMHKLIDALESTSIRSPSRSRMKSSSPRNKHSNVLEVEAMLTTSNHSGSDAGGDIIVAASASCSQSVRFPTHKVKARLSEKEEVEEESSFASGPDSVNDRHNANGLSDSDAVNSTFEPEYESEDESAVDSDECEHKSGNSSDASADEADDNSDESADELEIDSDENEIEEQHDSNEDADEVHSDTGGETDNLDDDADNSDSDEDSNADHSDSDDTEEISIQKLRLSDFITSGSHNSSLRLISSECRVDLPTFLGIISGFSPRQQDILLDRVWGMYGCHVLSVPLRRVIVHVNDVLGAQGTTRRLGNG